MRSNAVLIGLLVVALGIGLWTALNVIHGKSDHTAAISEQTVEQVAPGFVGKRRSGIWNLECVARPKLPKWAKSSLKAPGKDFPSLPSSPHCTVKSRISFPNDPTKWIDVIYMRAGKTSFFNVHFNVAPGYWSPGDQFGLRLDDRIANVKVILCGKPFCVALPMIKPKDIPNIKVTAGEQLVSAKGAAFLFPASAGQTSVTINIPLAGLREATDALKRVDTPGT